MASRGRYCFRLLKAVALVSLSLFTACLSIPVRVQPQTQGPGGEGTLADTAQIQSGKTTRDNVLRDWKWCDAHLDSDRLFVCILSRSKEKRVDTLGPIYVGSEGRRWQREEMFVEFDNRGVVTKVYFVPHAKFLRQMVSSVKSPVIPALDTSKPIEIKGEISTGSFLHRTWAEHGIVVLTSDGLQMRSEDVSAPTPVFIKVTQLRQLGGDYWSGQHLKTQGVPGWSNVNLTLEPADVFTLVRYLKQVNEPVLPR
jgi:hypothetical protein